MQSIARALVSLVAGGLALAGAEGSGRAERVATLRTAALSTHGLAAVAAAPRLRFRFAVGLASGPPAAEAPCVRLAAFVASGTGEPRIDARPDGAARLLEAFEGGVGRLLRPPPLVRRLRLLPVLGFDRVGLEVDVSF